MNGHIMSKKKNDSKHILITLLNLKDLKTYILDKT